MYSLARSNIDKKKSYNLLEVISDNYFSQLNFKLNNKCNYVKLDGRPIFCYVNINVDIA